MTDEQIIKVKYEGCPRGDENRRKERMFLVTLHLDL